MSAQHDHMHPEDATSAVRHAGERLMLSLPAQDFAYGLGIFHNPKDAAMPTNDSLRVADIDVPAGVRRLTLDEALADNELTARVSRIVAERTAAADALGAAHFAGLTSFDVIAVPDGFAAHGVLCIRGGSGMNASVVIIVGTGASLAVEETVDAEGSAPASLAVDIDLAPGASMMWRAVGGTARGTSYIRRRATLASGASLQCAEAWHVRGGFHFRRHEAVLTGEHAESRHALALFADGAARVDSQSESLHLAPRTTSRQDARAALDGAAKAIVRGMARIPSDTPHCSASQKTDTLLLGERAEVDAVPNLEIGTGEVAASHAAAAGPVDEDAMFFLMSRGVPREEARALVVEGFLAVALTAFDDTQRQRYFSALKENVL